MSHLQLLPGRWPGSSYVRLLGFVDRLAVGMTRAGMDVAGAWTHHSRSNAGGIPPAQRRGNAPLVALGFALAALGALGFGSLLGSAPPASNHRAVEAKSDLAKL